MKNELMLSFGERIDGENYKKRTAAYAIIFDQESVATVKTPQGYFLPGGGMDEGEMPEDTLEREVFEELGWKIKIQEFIGQAKQFFISPSVKNNTENTGYFFLTEKISESDSNSEFDHELMWLDISDATKKLFHDHQKWALNQALILKNG